MLLPKIKKIPQNTNAPAQAGLLVVFVLSSGVIKNDDYRCLLGVASYGRHGVIVS